MRYYPNILILTFDDVFKSNVQYTYTVRSFLGEWPKDKIYQLVCKDEWSDVRGKQNDHLFNLRREDKYLCFLHHRKKPVKGGPLSSGYTKGDKRKNFIAKLKEVCKYALGVLPYRISTSLDDYIRQSKVQVVYITPGYPQACNLAIRLANRYGIAILPHFLDDWPNAIYTDADWGWILRKFFTKSFSKFMKRCNSVICIGEAMCHEYRNRYGEKQYTPLMRSIDPRKLKGKKTDSILNFFYAGSLYLGRNKTISLLCDQIEILGMQARIRISIYTTENDWLQSQSLLSKYNFINYGGSINQRQIDDYIDTKTDVVLIVESFNSEYLKYTRLSMSTKIAESLASGHPIFAIGNREQGSIKYLHANEAAIVATNANEIQEGLIQILGNQSQKTLIESAHCLLLKNHTSKAQEEKFYNAVMAAISDKNHGKI